MPHKVPTQYRFNAGPASQPIAGSMPFIRFRCWPNIETELGDCPVFALPAIRVTLPPPKGHYRITRYIKINLLFVTVHAKVGSYQLSTSIYN